MGVAVCWWVSDDLFVIAETKDDLIKRLNEWKDNVENSGMRVNMNDNWRKSEANADVQDGHTVSVVEALV